MNRRSLLTFLGLVPAMPLIAKAAAEPTGIRIERVDIRGWDSRFAFNITETRGEMYPTKLFVDQDAYLRRATFVPGGHLPD